MKSRFRTTLRLLIVLNIVVVAMLAGTMVADWLRVLPTPGGPVAQSADPSPLASIETMQMGLAHIPTSNSCLLCHTEGGDAGLKPVPALGHPVEGWTACLSATRTTSSAGTRPGTRASPRASA